MEFLLNDRLTGIHCRFAGSQIARTLMDALSEILRSARLTGGVFLHAEFSEPWCVSSALKASDCSHYLGPADQMVLFHYVLEGCLTVIDAEKNAHIFLPGQAVILPRNDPHLLKGQQPATTVPALDVTDRNGPEELMVIRHGGGGEKTRIVCGFLGGRGLQHDPLLNALPPVFRYNGLECRSGSLVKTTLKYAATEMSDGQLGSEATLARISELLFVEAVRDYISNSKSGGLLDALKDRAVSRAIGLIHRYPGRRWVVETLAQECAVSRTVLTERFNHLLGCSPREFVQNTCMQLAARGLAEQQLNIADAAERAGYASEAAFSRAFKRHFGVSPSEWRKENT
ncbi:AraC family transcriptional regulator [Ruegeria atlantica]|uniref:AraC family transcriptional regulator n=1 Tax=Ruegeria atlantica TaxID=81569 RepID=UPI00147AB333|nr:AraC family transcriptional regulator [Ruegeria atlantica]